MAIAEFYLHPISKALFIYNAKLLNKYFFVLVIYFIIYIFALILEFHNVFFILFLNKTKTLKRKKKYSVGILDSQWKPPELMVNILIYF